MPGKSDAEINDATRIAKEGIAVPTDPITVITKGQRAGLCFDMIKMPVNADKIAPAARMQRSVNTQLSLKPPVY